MFGLGGEKYSKEAFEEAQEGVDKGKDYTVARMSEIAGNQNHAELEQALDIIRNSGEARKRLNDLLASGHTEAIKLDEEYNRLLDNARRAQVEIRDFEIKLNDNWFKLKREREGQK